MPPSTGSTSQVRLGTCSWSTSDWVGKVYLPGTKPVDYIAQYAQRFKTVEVDSSFYGTPRIGTIEGWRDRTPPEFIFSAKAPQVITHDKMLLDCQRELQEFLNAMTLLGDRLGPLVFQFPYYSKKTGVDEKTFLTRLDAFLPLLPRDSHRFVVEVRNKAWITKRLLALLREHHVTLAFIDHPWMHSPEWFSRHEELLTGDFAYFRWLGDRYGIEKLTKTWGEHVIDRRNDIARWVPAIKQILDKEIPVFGYFNSHYSGYAPGDVEILSELLGLR
ncbi:MAG: DUF72 domain-containing protein [Candidatus Hydrogenedentes bacterium]|nr:DUF72 domain-containing protein [Candidatus Hydrogenedentota bacterium]